MSSAAAEKRERYASECYRRICSHRGVTDCVVCNRNGCPVHSTMPNRADTLEFVGLFGQLILRTKASLKSLLGDADEAQDLQSLRIRSHKHEVLITLDKDHSFFVVQSLDSN